MGAGFLVRRAAPWALAAILFGIAASALAQNADPLVAASSLLAQCGAVEPSAKPRCAELSKAVANNHDPTGPLPTAKAIEIGDIHITGPWSAAIVLRRDASNNWNALAVVASKTSKDIAVTAVRSAQDVAQLTSGASAEGTAAVVVQGANALAAAGAGTAPGWVTDAYYAISPDITKIGEDSYARFLDLNIASLPIGEGQDALPLRSAFVDTTYVRRGYFVAARPGDHRFAIGVEPAGMPAIVPDWECWARLDVLDGADRHTVFAHEPITFAADTPPARIPTETSSVVTLPAGLTAVELVAHCVTGAKWRPEEISNFLRTHSVAAAQPNPWPTITLKVQRPGEGVFTPLGRGDIVHETAAYPGLQPAMETRTAASAEQPADPLHARGLPGTFKAGWYVDVFPIVGNDASAWTIPPQSPLQATFVSASTGFTLTDHRRAGMPDRDGKIYVANSMFLAPRDGRYTFMIVADNAHPEASGIGRCVSELTLSDRAGSPTRMIEVHGANLQYLAGPSALSIPNLGGANLHEGAYRLTWRAACEASALADITGAPLADTRFKLYVRQPGENALRPIDPGMVAYKGR